MIDVVLLIVLSLIVVVYLSSFIYLLHFLKNSIDKMSKKTSESFVHTEINNPTKKTFYNPTYGTFELPVEKRKAKHRSERDEVLFEREQKGYNNK